MVRVVCCGRLSNLVGELVAPRRNVDDAGVCCNCEHRVDGGEDGGCSVTVMAMRMEARDDRGFCGVMKADEKQWGREI